MLTILREFYTPYLGKRDIDGVHKYKYAADDQGFFYPIFWSPCAAYLVNFVPEWLAPNLITMAGFAVAMLPFMTLYT